MAPKDRAPSLPSLAEANTSRVNNAFAGPIDRTISEEEDEGPLAAPTYEKEEASYSGAEADVPPPSNNPVRTSTTEKPTVIHPDNLYSIATAYNGTRTS
jgi:hypothetical protein